MKNEEIEMIECPDCEEGSWWFDTSGSCGTVRGECCGGCGYKVECETCEGSGEIENEY